MKTEAMVNPGAKEDMLTEISFEVPGQPFGKQRPRVVNNGAFSKAYTPKETVAYENLVKLYFTQAARGKVFGNSDMLEIEIAAYYEIPKSTSKRKREQMLGNRIRPTKKPDFDNIGKAICDSLNQVAYHDDSSIVEARISKYYSDRPRVDVTIRAIKTEGQG